MSWNNLKGGRGDGFPAPPAKQGSTLELKQAAGKEDGRKARATGRTKQFNPKVQPAFMERFDRARTQEEEDIGERVTQAYFLEILLARHEKERGVEISPFGLSQAARTGAEAIAKKMGWNLSAVVEDAIAARCRELGLLGEKHKR